ncbi:hypothetical protein AGR1B_pTi0186 [Agrobacterium fabacearum S56]|uniref:Uncharacterized protein n=1 Tax=Agrobacterium deltaense Zutra 3/1 TaxID=1183427 RepID=A0A1S7S548_9HYPH|nr:hypothetical protein AGR1B_pTi0186 [Agrobacterium fabacearum S56]CUX62729.1 hypothetical protein AGR7C_pTi0021 [Agrobacterium deltaense Zutra 3/1]
MLCRKPTIVDGFHLSLEPKVAQNKSHSEVVGLPPGQLDYRRKRLQPVACAGRKPSDQHHHRALLSRLLQRQSLFGHNQDS